MADKNILVDIDSARTLLQSALFSNRYLGIFTGSVFGNNNKFGYMMSNISFPQFTYNAKEQYVGGVNVSVVNLFEQGQLEITVYNTGKELDTIYKWGEKHYNQKTRCYGYMDDIYAELLIYEYDRKNNIILKHYFHKCSLYTYGNITLSYEEAQQVETFQMGIKYNAYELIKEKNVLVSKPTQSNSPEKVDQPNEAGVYPGGWMV